MRHDTLARLEEKFREFPRSRATGVPVAEIEEAAKELALTFPREYTEFLLRYGGAEVGAYPIFGLRKAASMGNTYSVVEVTKEFRAAGIPGNPAWLIVSDGGANGVKSRYLTIGSLRGAMARTLRVIVAGGWYHVVNR